MRLVIVSNRLPMTFEYQNETLTSRPSTGGLATGLNAFITHLKKKEHANVIWVGCPGGPEEQQEAIENQLMSTTFKPIFLPKKIESLFMNGFCNQVLWPMFHELSPFMKQDDEIAWLSYKQANDIFYQSLITVLHPDDVVWIHDYHLFLLPALLRAKFPSLKIGFFLHIPFPKPQYFKHLYPTIQQELLNGVLGANVIGFHVQDYLNNFSKCCFDLLNAHSTTKLITAPMGIDFDFFNQGLNLNQFKMNDVKTILSVDRLDYSKGAASKLQAYRYFLEKHPEWQHRVVLTLIVAPSRQTIQAYQQTKTEIEQLVIEINKQFGCDTWLPIQYDYNIFSLDKLRTLYSTADIALITPLKDGMNLVAKEYIASRLNTGVLILSRHAGAAKELTDAIIVDPSNIQEIASAIHQALIMNPKQQKHNLDLMQRHLRRYNVIQWGNDFINHLTFP